MTTAERRALAEAITRTAFAMQKVEQAEATLEKAFALSANLHEQAAELSSLADDINTAKAASLKLALEAGEAPVFEETSSFAVPRLKKERLDQQISGVKDSLPVLQAELETARLEADECNSAVEHCAEAVIAIEAEQMAISFMEKLEDLRREHYILAGFMNRWLSRAPSERTVNMHGASVRGVRQIKLPNIVGVAASQPILGDSELKGGARIRDAITSAVSAYWAALKDDANARLDELPQADHPSPIVIPEFEFTDVEMKL